MTHLKLSILLAFMLATLLPNSSLCDSLPEMFLINKIYCSYLGYQKNEYGEDGEAVLAKIHGKTTPNGECAYTYATLPDTLKCFDRWDFDVYAHDREQEKKMAKDKMGLYRLKEDGYDDHPSEEKLHPFNPSVRDINRNNELYAEDVLKKAGYKRCDDLFQKEKPEENEPFPSVMAWEIEANTYLEKTYDNTAAWRVRKYTFVLRENDEMIPVVSFNSLPSPEIARTVRGVIQEVPEAYNNMAVIMENRLTAFGSYDEEEVEILFKMAVKLGYAPALENLVLFYLSHGKKEEVKELIDKIQKDDKPQESEEKVAQKHETSQDDEKEQSTEDSFETQRQKGIELANENKIEEAEKIFQQLAKEKDAFSIFLLGVLKYNAGDYKTAADFFMQAAKLNEPSAQFRLACLKLEGKGIPKDVTGGEKLLLHVVESTDDREALYRLGHLYYFGNDVPKDEAKGLQFLTRACEPLPPRHPQGYDQAQFLVGMILKEKENRTEEENKQMFHYLESAASQNNAKALKQLVYIYISGFGLPAFDDVKALEYCEKLVKLEPTADNYFLCGVLCEECRNGEANLPAARMWYAHAAHLGHPEAIYRCAGLLANNKQFELALKYLRKPENTTEEGKELLRKLEKREK